MKQPFRLLALLLGLVLLMSLLSPLALAEEPEKEVPDGEELIATPEEDDGFIDIGEDEAVDEYWEELRNFWGAEYVCHAWHRHDSASCGWSWTSLCWSWWAISAAA